MQIIILGAGKIGQVLCQELSEKHNVVVIDQQDQLIESLINKYDITGVVGNGTLLEVQKEAGIDNADIFIAATGADESNIIAASIAKTAGAKHTVSRVRNPEYAIQFDFMKKALGITLIINPELSAAMDIARAIRYASALSVETLAGNRVALVKIEVKAQSQLAQMNLMSFRLKYGNVLVCIVERGDDVFIPSGSTQLQEGDKIYVAGQPKDMTKFHRQIGNSEKNIRSVMIVGAGRITDYLLQLLEQTHADVKVIEHNLDRCEEISSKYPYVRTIYADGTNTEVLDEQGLADYDAFVSLTGVDEENVVASIYANNVGVRKVITKMSRTNILKVINDQSLKKVVTPKNLVASEIARFVRSRANAQGSNVEALYRVADNRVEVLQFKVESVCRLVNIPLNQLKLRDHVLIAYILRKGKVIFPNGQDTLQAEDSVIVVTTDRSLEDLKDIAGLSRGDSHE